MAQRNLRELLLEDQEPFRLERYISDRRIQIGRSSPAADFQVKRQKPITKIQNVSLSFCKNSCFLPVRESPEPRKSPAFDFQSPAKSPNRVFIRIPARTASLLLEAAVKIHNQSSRNTKSRPENRGNRSGLFGSVLKRLIHRGRNSGNERARLRERASETRIGCSRRFNDKRGNAVLTEIDEEDDDSLDCVFEEASSSGRLDDFESVDELAFETAEAGDLDLRETCFCSSPFRFSLQTSPYSSHGHSTPNFTSPATSPSRHTTEKNSGFDKDKTEKLGETEEEEEENGEKEQCSPVSVLDTPKFHENGPVDEQEDEEDEDQHFDYECTYQSVQRAKQRLLEKLCRFEQLAGLDPADLETKQENNGNDDDEDDESMGEERNRTPKLVWMKMCSWKEIDYKCVDGIVEQEMKCSMDDWKRHQEQVQETAMEIELAVFGSLVEELSEEIVGFR